MQCSGFEFCNTFLLWAFTLAMAKSLVLREQRVDWRVDGTHMHCIQPTRSCCRTTPTYINCYNASKMSKYGASGVTFESIMSHLKILIYCFLPKQHPSLVVLGVQECLKHISGVNSTCKNVLYNQLKLSPILDRSEITCNYASLEILGNIRVYSE